MSFRLYGLKNNPDGWEVLEPGVFTDASAFIQEPEFFVKEFPTYRECRKWVVKELEAQRKKLGRCMERWLQVPEHFKEKAS